LACSVAVSVETSASWTRIFYPTMSSYSMPQQFPDPCCWKSECLEDTSCPRPLQADRRCFTYRYKGHFANRCPNSCPRANHPATATPTPSYGANSIPIAAKQNHARGRVNHVVVEEAQEAPDVVLDMFLINATSVVMLFDYGASHSFISAAYVEKHNLLIALLK
jgi:hypothetical protein